MTVAKITQRLATVPLASLRPHPRNPKLHANTLIAESFKETGWYGAVLVQESTMFLLAGHGRCEELRAAGEETVDAFLLDVDDDTALRILLGENEISRRGGYNQELLAELLVDMESNDLLLGTGFTQVDIESMLETSEVVVIEPPEFQGGFAEPPAATDKRMRPATPNKMAGLREFVLVYPENDFHRLMDAIGEVNSFHSTDSNSNAILAGMLAYAAELRRDREEKQDGE